ncbi:membrane protein [Endozoicomonas montiporae]|uniref:Outer membrane protein assembly factor BamE n=2 Tax=Endozoicomonas montiporae TaxID=1027273 RepID=A0A081N3A3_9GAMM|nr:outer membrane protein assembly factor BamE [Endozoicomonas montiporae]AMO58219.1 SmpA/OmlA domain-containing protein [Endozoicomonas montiporae CL-33]KEQ12926.1 membrane protein [Endozoicomonas montiporae]
MQKTPALTAALLSAALLAGCASSTDSGSRLISFPGAYKIDIQQGTVITQEMVDQLRPGMTRSQVQYVMGSPLLEDAFDRDRWDYVYSMQPGGGKRTQQTLTIFFKDDKLVSVQGDLRPTPQ